MGQARSSEFVICVVGSAPSRDCCENEKLLQTMLQTIDQFKFPHYLRQSPTKLNSENKTKVLSASHIITFSTSHSLDQ